MGNSSNNKENIAFSFLYGFETKSILNSGFYNMFEDSNKYILKRNFKSILFEKYKQEYDLNTYEFSINNKHWKVLNFAIASRKAYNRINNIENFNYFNQDRKIKWSDYLIGNKLVKNFFTYIVNMQIKNKFLDNKLLDFYDRNNINKLILTGYSSPEAIALASSALKYNIKLYLIINSWKDLYVNNYIPFKPNKIFVWNQNMKNQIIKNNPHIKEKNIILSGNPVFDRYYNYRPYYSKEYYYNKYNIKQNKKIILYTMLSPLAYKGEYKIIKLISKMLENQYNENTPILILRKNPLDDNDYKEIFKDFNNIRVADDYFESSYDDAIFIQDIEGEKEWFDLLYYSDVNINVASTVSLEALMLGTPVINIEFNEFGKQDNNLSRYTQAPFYKPLLNRRDLFVCKDIKSFGEKINFCLNEKIKIDSLSDLIGKFDGGVRKLIINEIKD